ALERCAEVETCEHTRTCHASRIALPGQRRSRSVALQRFAELARYALDEFRRRKRASMRAPFQNPRDHRRELGAREREAQRTVGRLFEPLCPMPFTRRDEERLLARELDDHLVESLRI